MTRDILRHVTTVVIAGKDPIKVVRAADGTIIASHKMCVEADK